MIDEDFCVTENCGGECDNCPLFAAFHKERKK